MKLSDYVVRFIENLGVRDVFFLPGGGMMHLLDSLAQNTNIRKYCNLNEQATTISCEGYSLYTNKPGVAFLTTGPGSTNAITGVVDAYIDSTPLIVISGQAKRADLMTGKNVRQVGPQECNIIDIISPTTKYAVSVLDANQIKYHLQKAAYLAMNGRRGPVWLEIPLDIQSAEIDVETLPEFIPEPKAAAFSAQEAKEVFTLLNQAKRPAILIGNGVRCCAEDSFLQLAQKLHIPVLSSWRARDTVAGKYDLYYGCPGSLAPRYSNFIIQNCDCLVVIGARLNYCMTAFNEMTFAPLAKKIIVDIDSHELDLLVANYEKKIQADAHEFVNALLVQIASYQPLDITDWLDYCQKCKDRFPLAEEKQPSSCKYIDGYQLGHSITRHLKADDVIAGASSGRASAIVPMSLGTASPNRFIAAMGLGSMGYTIPLAIGSCIASGKKRVICMEGDGSLQHNLQELQLIKTYNLPIKIFVLNNNGYSAVLGMQRAHFDSRLLACNPSSGLSLPDIKKTADLYDLNYYYLDDPADMERIVKDAMDDPCACICEVKIDPLFEEIPRAATKLDENGNPYSLPLEDLYPFISEKDRETFTLD